MPKEPRKPPRVQTKKPKYGLPMAKAMATAAAYFTKLVRKMPRYSSSSFIALR
jgi:hypothetical protein